MLIERHFCLFHSIDDPPPSNNYSCGPCPAGYRGDGYDCQDFDACSANPAACPDDHFCVDRIPPSEAFDCESCLDAGPCCPNPCFQGGTCVAIGSSFECACPLGYEGDGVNCTDINACSASPPPCFPGAQCDDLPPPALEAKCGACPAGYAGDGSFSGCVDYDPCREVPDFCDATAECIDLPPPSMSANCVILTMNPTTNPTDGPTDNSNGCNPNPCFSIVDEIRGIDFQADCNIVSSSAASVPSAPSFICGACPENLGFSADPSGNQSHCVDTDGCLAQQALTGALPCFPGVQCDDVSAPGIGFLCGLCPSGYEGSGNFGDCFEIDGCNTNPPPCFAGVQCVDLPPPFTNALCGQCPLGYSGNGSFSGGCVDFDACIGSSCFSGPGGECRDHPPPSYGATCTCAEGYFLCFIFEIASLYFHYFQATLGMDLTTALNLTRVPMEAIKFAQQINPVWYSAHLFTQTHANSRTLNETDFGFCTHFWTLFGGVVIYLSRIFHLLRLDFNVEPVPWAQFQTSQPVCCHPINRFLALSLMPVWSFLAPQRPYVLTCRLLLWVSTALIALKDWLCQQIRQYVFNLRLQNRPRVQRFHPLQSRLILLGPQACFLLSFPL